ncbi:MAG: LysM peptidoglycan-binding domain-containing protein [bacterium]|nr:LysM peptidoglycan-binding domain-containing protein [bacterium]
MNGLHRHARLVLLVWLLTTLPAWAQEWRIHKVARGENLTLIANRYGVELDDLRAWNDLRSDELAIGQDLRIPEENQEWYVVKRGDTLLEIALAHDITLDLLRRLNDLRRDDIHVGQRLRLRPAPSDEPVHVVRRGDTLHSVSRRHDLSVADLKRINDLAGDRIYVGQQLRLREVDRTIHVVERGDALGEVAKAYGLTVAELKALNGLESNVIHPGQELRLRANGEVQLATYQVRRGDNLTEIARLHQMSLRELRDLNGIRGSVIHPGQALTVRPRLGTAAENGDFDWKDLAVTVPGVRRFDTANGPYYWSQPRATAQPGSNYKEEQDISPRLAYRNARTLWRSFTERVDLQPRLGHELAGWHFVLDPGHGGIDPGAIVMAEDAAGKKYWVVEDEYAYDLALRTAALLILHGAEVTLTTLSSTHLLRGNEPVGHTFVHERDEVFNDEAWNRSNRPSDWPKGGQAYLNERITVAKRAFQGVPANRQVFLSFHADNVRSLGNVVTLFYYQRGNSTDSVSRDFARKLLPGMGAGARIAGKSLGVLRHNPTRYKLLVEMRNLAYEDHIWAVRYSELRQRDAEKIVRALIDVVGNGV